MKKRKNYTWVVTIQDAIRKSHIAKVLWEEGRKKS